MIPAVLGTEGISAGLREGRLGAHFRTHFPTRLVYEVRGPAVLGTGDISTGATEGVLRPNCRIHFPTHLGSEGYLDPTVRGLFQDALSHRRHAKRRTFGAGTREGALRDHFSRTHYSTHLG